MLAIGSMDEADALQVDADSKSPAPTLPHQVTPEDVQASRQELLEQTRRSLLERGQMSEIRERLRELSERLSKLTSPSQDAAD